MKAHDFNSVPQSLRKIDFFFACVCLCVCECVCACVFTREVCSPLDSYQGKLEKERRAFETERRKEEEREASLQLLVTDSLKTLLL